MVNRFQDVVHGNAVSGVNGIRFKNHPRLRLGQSAAFDAVGVVSHVHLQFLVEAAGNARVFFVPQDLQNGVVRDFTAEFVRAAAEMGGEFFQRFLRQLFRQDG